MGDPHHDLQRFLFDKSDNGEGRRTLLGAARLWGALFMPSDGKSFTETTCTSGRTISSSRLDSSPSERGCQARRGAGRRGEPPVRWTSENLLPSTGSKNESKTFPWLSHVGSELTQLS
jgi:hypothetical protein